MIAIGLKTEYLVDPVGIDSRQPQMMPNVMTARIVTRWSGVRMELSRATPMFSAAISATVASYWRLPMTDRRSQATGTPRLPARAMTPSRMEREGRRVKVADLVTAFLRTFLSLPIAMPARQLLMMKTTHSAAMKSSMTPTTRYSGVEFAMSRYDKCCLLIVC